ncbi:hypothetical protein [Cryptosporangium sp. NPDC051539]|uniref:hypothetical protein n=1 Tax=Cryptosporangium sp. NPDC051539 TaxID=3363962 RepID=UPI003793ADE8
MESKTLSWENLTRGDCTLNNGVLTLFDDGRVSWSASVRSSDASGPFSDSDSWQMTITLQDAYRNPIVTLPQLGSPSMTSDNMSYSWNQDFPSVPAVAQRFNDITRASSSSHC